MPRQQRTMPWLKRIGLAGLLGHFALGSAMTLAEVGIQRSCLRRRLPVRALLTPIPSSEKPAIFLIYLAEIE